MKLLRRLGLVLVLATSAAALAGSYEESLEAASLGQTATLGALLAKGLDPDTADADGNSLLILAARDGHLEAVDLLLKYRARVTRRNLAGDSAPMLAALKGYREIVKRFIAVGVPLDGDGWTPLMYAAFEGHAEIAGDLLKAGAEVDARAPNLATPLMLAARNGHIRVVETLLAAGADTTLKNDRNKTAAEWAMDNANTDIAELIRRHEKKAGGAKR